MTTFIDFLLSRHSQKKLSAPAPQGQQLQQILQAAMQAPDHGHLKPYRFVVIENEGKNKLEKLLQSAVDELNLGEERKLKATDVSHRAPMIIAVIAKIDERKTHQIPAWEQFLTAGCATYGLQLAANALGFDNVWISGPWVEGTELRQTLGCENEQDKVIALVMLGTADNHQRTAREHDVSNYVSYL